MIPYMSFLLIGVLLAIFSDQIEAAAHHHPLVERLLPVVSRALVLAGFVGAVLARIDL